MGRVMSGDYNLAAVIMAGLPGARVEFPMAMATGRASMIFRAHSESARMTALIDIPMKIHYRGNEYKRICRIPWDAYTGMLKGSREPILSRVRTWLKEVRFELDMVDEE